MQVFVVGAPRSGTTRLKTAIADALAVPQSGEGHFFPIVSELDATFDSYFERLRSRAGPRTMVQQVDAEALRRGIHERIRAAFESVAGPVFVEKSPGPEAIRALPFVREQWPEAKVVFARRRGIENVISALHKFPHWTFEAACRSWTEAMSAWLQLDPGIRDSAMAVDQLTMAREPAAVAAAVGAHLGFDPARVAILEEAFGKRAHAKRNTRVSSMEELQQDPIPLAETPWSEEQRAKFVAVCGPTMEAFGYAIG